jgi:anthranilate/para-aminobenzoate synthase component I
MSEDRERTCLSCSPGLSSARRKGRDRRNPGRATAPFPDLQTRPGDRNTRRYHLPIAATEPNPVTPTPISDRPQTPLAAGPGDPAPRPVLDTQIHARLTPDILVAALAPPGGGADRLILIPYDAAHAFEPAIARAASRAAAASLPMVVQTLGSPPLGPGRRDRSAPPSAPVFTTTPLTPAWPRPEYTAAVAECLRLIAAGDAYQINLAHHLTATFRGDALALYTQLAAAARPAHAGFLCWDDPTTRTRHAVLSLSPELFLEYDPATRRIRTQPMKGTRPFASDPAELDASEKDRAELNMIVDLMRNDLGRVGVPGSVRVTRPRDIDPHANSVWQATATVEGTLREGLTAADLLAAAFPPGSVTGAPKVRAAQIIRSLEPLPRGPYCGTLVRLHPDGRLTASVLIRTAHIHGTPDPGGPHAFLDARLDFPVGAGIVADSDPDAEWQETLTKARVLTDTLGLTTEPGA